MRDEILSRIAGLEHVYRVLHQAWDATPGPEEEGTHKYDLKECREYVSDTLRTLRRAAQDDPSLPRFSIGQPVEVVPYRNGWQNDWIDTPLWVIGIERYSAGFVYSVVEKWPPTFGNRADGSADGITTTFHEEDLQSSVTTPATSEQLPASGSK